MLKFGVGFYVIGAGQVKASKSRLELDEKF